MRPLRHLFVILLLLVVTGSSAVAAGWKWSHCRNTTPGERVAGWTWDGQRAGL